MSDKADLSRAIIELVPPGQLRAAVCLYVVVEIDGRRQVKPLLRAGPGCRNSALRAAPRLRGFRYVERYEEYTLEQYRRVFGCGPENRRNGY